ncbi:MAG: hypothetical protein ACO3QY_06535, partial [Burkholderiaceae bacterium]
TITKGSDLVLGPFCLPETSVWARVWPAEVADSLLPVATRWIVMDSLKDYIKTIKSPEPKHALLITS